MPARADRKAPPKARSRSLAPHEPLFVPPLSHPAMLLAVLVLLASAAIGATFVMSDTDMWQHLAVGRAIWTTHSIPMTNVWSWPTYGAPQVLPSWLFRALLWPFYQAGGMSGVQVWRWVTTVAIFLVAWLTARKLGARGFASVAILAWAALVYRHRVYVRPETLSAVLLALTQWVLLTRRTLPAGASTRRSWLLVLLAWIWPNAHISYWMFFAVTGLHAFAEAFDRSPKKPSLWIVLAAAVVVSFANPWGWKTLEEPFLYAFVWSKEPIFQTIGELLPVDWKFLATTGYLELLILWPVLATARAFRREKWDIAELLTMAFFTVLGLKNQRFVSVWAVVAAPYLARDVAALAAAVRWPAALRPVWVRLVLVTALITGGSLPDWRRSDLPFGTGVVVNSYPAGACEFLARHGIRGHGFNHFEMGGYMVWRFWPEKDRLPFFDIHLTGKPEDRLLAGMMLSNEAAWHRLDTQYQFPFALLRRLHGPTDVSLDIVEADSNFALVFLDDAAAVYVRRHGPFAAVADSFGFRITRAGRAGMREMGLAFAQDSTARTVLRGEFERMIASSPANANAHSLLSQLDLTAGDFAGARTELAAAYTVDATIPLYWERLGWMLMREGKLDEARRALEESTRRDKSATGWAWLGAVRARLGERERAIEAYRRALKLDPGNDAARAGLDSLGTS